MLIAGDEDIAANAVSFRYRDGLRKMVFLFSDAVEEIVSAVEARVQV